MVHPDDDDCFALDIVESPNGANHGGPKTLYSFCGNVKPNQAWLHFVPNGDEYAFTSSDGVEYVAVAPMYGTAPDPIENHHKVWAVTRSEFDKQGYYLGGHGEAMKIVDTPNAPQTQEIVERNPLTHQEILDFLKNDPSKCCLYT